MNEMKKKKTQQIKKTHRRDKIDFVAQPTKGKFVLMMGEVYGLPNVISHWRSGSGDIHSNDIVNILNTLRRKGERENISHMTQQLNTQKQRNEIVI